jgi:triosephosphate isomerase
MKLIVANLKCNPTTLKEAKFLFNSIRKGLRNFKNVEVVICPPFIYLPIVHRSSFKLGAQDCFWEEKGAFTGEISPKMLKNLGVKYVIIGHSERRQILKETDEMINKKLKAVIKAKLRPILCIGETEKERKKGKTFQVLKSQIKKALSGISSFTVHRSKFIFAYEPVWAIGTGNPCQPKEAKEVLIFLKKITKQLNNLPTQQLILYGGSVNSQNAKDYIEVGFDGLLVGGASLNPKEFIEIVKSCA